MSATALAKPTAAKEQAGEVAVTGPTLLILLGFLAAVLELAQFGPLNPLVSILTVLLGAVGVLLGIWENLATVASAGRRKWFLVASLASVATFLLGMGLAKLVA